MNHFCTFFEMYDRNSVCYLLGLPLRTKSIIIEIVLITSFEKEVEDGG